MSARALEERQAGVERLMRIVSKVLADARGEGYGFVDVYAVFKSSDLGFMSVVSKGGVVAHQEYLELCEADKGSGPVLAELVELRARAKALEDELYATLSGTVEDLLAEVKRLTTERDEALRVATEQWEDDDA